MKPREILATSATPDGEAVELVREAGRYVIRVAGVPLMSSARSGSEEAMAHVAREVLGERRGPRILVGGLGMGFTLRAVLDAFGSDARVVVAELLGAIVEHNRGVLGELASRPLDDPRVRLFEGDVRVPLETERFDAILMDVDNGPDAFTTRSNARLYDDRGAARLALALEPGGVLVVWSAYEDRGFEKRLRRAGLETETRRAYARSGAKKGGRHVLFVATKPAARRRG